MNEERNRVVALDIGTSKVVALVGELDADGCLEIIGIGSHKSTGLRKAWWWILNLPCNRFNALSRKQN